MLIAFLFIYCFDYPDNLKSSHGSPNFLKSKVWFGYSESKAGIGNG